MANNLNVAEASFRDACFLFQKFYQNFYAYTGKVLDMIPNNKLDDLHEKLMQDFFAFYDSISPWIQKWEDETNAVFILNEAQSTQIEDVLKAEIIPISTLRKARLLKMEKSA